MLIGIDQGTTGTSCVALDRQLRVRAQSYRELSSRFPRPGWVEQDPEEILSTVRESVAEVLDQIGDQPVLAAGLANQGETVVPWDARSGEALGPALVWSDTRAESVVERLSRAGSAQRIASLTGLRLDSYFSAAKMAWLLENDEVISRAAQDSCLALGTLDTWLGWRLAGKRLVTDHSTASRTQLLRLGGDSWDQELLELFCIPAGTLAELRTSLGNWGELADRSWPRPLPWRASLVDQAAALVGNACFSVGETKVTYGTGCFVLVNAGGQPPIPPEGLLAMTAWSRDGEKIYALDGGAFTAGTAISWLQKIGVIGAAAETAALAASVPDAGGVRFLPALTGLGSPWWRSTANGIFSGLTGGTTRAHLVRAVLDSIAFRVRDILEAMWNAGLPRPEALRVDGGLTRNGYLLQRQADILGLPISSSRHTEATAVGAAAMAGMAEGVLGEESVRTLLAPQKTIEPRLPAETREAEYEDWRIWLEKAIEL